jgi:signal peptidase I
MSTRRNADRSARTAPYRDARVPARRAGYPPTRSGRRPPKRHRKRRRNPLRVLFGWILAAAIAFVLAMVLRTFVFTLVRVSSASMDGTIRRDDIVLMTRFDYWLSAPARGEVVGFAPSENDPPAFKRVVGAPRDTVEMKNGTVLVNGEALSEPYVTNNEDSSFMPTELAEGYYILLGDNRGESLDSRSEEIGLIATRQIEGRARYILWPPERQGVVE